MPRAVCAAAAENSQSIIAVDGCRTYIGRVEFLMSSVEFASMPERKQWELVKAVQAAQKDLEPACEKFCQRLQLILDHANSNEDSV